MMVAFSLEHEMPSLDEHQVPTDPNPGEDPVPDEKPSPDEEPVPDHNPVAKKRSSKD
jgi:hypothetical protein